MTVDHAGPLLCGDGPQTLAAALKRNSAAAPADPAAASSALSQLLTALAGACKAAAAVSLPSSVEQRPARANLARLQAVVEALPSDGAQLSAAGTSARLALGILMQRYVPVSGGSIRGL